MMAREEILEGLRLAVSRGHPLQDAMQSFFNAGYKREDIEYAARMFNSSQSLTPQTQRNQVPQKPQIQSKPSPNSPSKSPPINGYPIMKNPFAPKQMAPATKPVQKKQIAPPPGPKRPYPHSAFPNSQVQRPKTVPVVSKYEGDESQEGKKTDTVTIILFVVLLILIIALVSVFIFKDSLIQFLNRFLE